jgi:hypothetical protein
MAPVVEFEKLSNAIWLRPTAAPGAIALPLVARKTSLLAQVSHDLDGRSPGFNHLRHTSIDYIPSA